MYSPNVLEELIEKNKQGKLWDNILFIRSSPGAGKTSILKVLEPNSLLTLSNSASSSNFKDTITYLKSLEVLDNKSKVNLVGVYMSLARNYEVIEDLNISTGQKKNIFFALINARVILSSLRSILNLYNHIELSQIVLNASSFDYSYLDIRFPIDGEKLFEWAATIERSVFKLIDSFLPINDLVVGHSELFAFQLMQPNNLMIDGIVCSNRILFMFDDGHKLGKSQREALLDHLTVKRGNYNIWIAERLEALDEQRNFGALKNRDYDEINLEEIWQGPNNKLKNILANIANKRASVSSEHIDGFQDFIDENLKESEYEERFIKAYEQSLQNINMLAGFNHKFENWLDYLTSMQEMTKYNLAILARQIEILIYRNIGKSQLTFEFPFTVDELKSKLGGEIQSTAIYFICIEQKIPFYYGFDNLVKLSSNNIEQFLAFSAELFELVLARKVASKPRIIEANEQERFLKKVAETKWQEQSRILPNADAVLKFIANLAQFSQKETNKPNAPYAPGINGFAIKELKENKLILNIDWREDPAFITLRKVLKTCIAYNLLEKRLTKQGKENQVHTVYYLNRWICLRYNLPLNYGGFRHKLPSDLIKWTK
ncbi:hypothetical protein [Pedobacter antarcticus]|uniref:ORC-CDC6 family AAA ATPase n=1 Tax=Pedobacter antarcticus TaxID=34086 RepID=UPI0029304529|nr:hypothetical protein [Pedobacter antarcticus]